MVRLDLLNETQKQKLLWKWKIDRWSARTQADEKQNVSSGCWGNCSLYFGPGQPFAWHLWWTTHCRTFKNRNKNDALCYAASDAVDARQHKAKSDVVATHSTWHRATKKKEKKNRRRTNHKNTLERVQPWPNAIANARTPLGWYRGCIEWAASPH